MITDLDAVILETGNGKIARVFGEPFLDGAAEQRLFARSGDLGFGR